MFFFDRGQLGGQREPNEGRGRVVGALDPGADRAAVVFQFVDGAAVGERADKWRPVGAEENFGLASPRLDIVRVGEGEALEACGIVEDGADRPDRAWVVFALVEDVERELDVCEEDAPGLLLSDALGIAVRHFGPGGEVACLALDEFRSSLVRRGLQLPLGVGFEFAHRLPLVRGERRAGCGRVDDVAVDRDRAARFRVLLER